MKGTLFRNWPAALFGLLLLLALALLPAACGGAPALVHQAAPALADTPIPVPPTAAPSPPSPTPDSLAITRWSFEPHSAGPVPPPLPASYPRPEDAYSSPNHSPTSPRDVLTITFDRPVMPEWVADHFVLTPALAGQFTAWDEHTVAFAPTSGWQPNIGYLAHVTGVKRQAGFTFRTWPFVYGSAVDPTGLDPHESIHLAFAYPMDKTSVYIALHVQPRTPYRVHWEGSSLFLDPADEWALDTTYTVTLDASAAEATGTTLSQPWQWSFRTPSGVRAVGPQGTASVCSPITVAFDWPADHASAEAALHISPTVAGTFEWQDNQLRFTPRDGWRGGTTYQLSLEPSIRSVDGTPLLQRCLDWHFTADEGPGHVDFGYGPNIQVLDAAGSRQIQFVWRSGKPACAVFSLYQVTPEWLLPAYSSSFKEEAPLPDLAGLPLARQWQEEISDGEATLPADVSPGLYVLTTGDGQDGLLIVLTHHTLILKEAGIGVGSTAEHQVSAYASAIATGKPQPGMAVRIYDRSGRLYGEGTTDEQGRITTTVPGDTDPLLALGEVDGEVTLCGFGPEWSAQGRWWWGWSTNPPTGRRFRSYLYTDRPIYRPGQTVYVKAVVRADDDARYSVPPTGTPVTVRLRDARDNVLATQVLATGEFGTVHTSFTLAEGSTLGGYNVEAVVGDEVTRQALKVEEYRKPDYEVTVTADCQQVLSGEAFTVTVEAHYYFGRPLAGVTANLLMYQHVSDAWDDSIQWDKISHAPYSCRTDAQGRCQLRVTVPGDSYSYGYWYSFATLLSLEATVDDGSGQAVSGHTTVQLYYARAGTSLFLDHYAFQPGEDIPIDLLVRDYKGQPVGGAQLQVGIYSYDSGGWGYHTPAVETWVTTDAAGRVHTALHVDQQGWYRLGVKGYGEVESWVWIYDPSDSAPWSGPSGDLVVSVDQPSYIVGETARLLIHSPVTGTALLTLQRGRVHMVQPIELAGPVTTLPLQVQGDFAPNIFATVQIYRPLTRDNWSSGTSRPDAELLVASTEIVVPVPERQLEVTITPERAEYAPREQAVVVLQVSDSAGWPARAELSLAMVDEAIYALSQDLSLDPFAAFYSQRENLVRTYHSLEPTRYLYSDGRGSGGDGFSPGNPRRNFPDTAYWNPAIVTDENGRAVVTIPIPDSLTRWRLLARAVTVETWVGQGTASITVTQPLVVRPALPRFLVQGDTFTLTTTVHNYSGGAIQVQAGLQAQGLAVHSPLTCTVGLAAGETAPLGWAVAADTLGPVTVTAYAAGAGLADAVQHNIPVVPFAVPQVDSRAGEFAGERVERFTLPENYIPEVTQVEVRLAPSVVPTLLDGLEYLVGYPFG
jgi:uncharacterized protein YfaS (alpha-2-macroglobulin family)